MTMTSSHTPAFDPTAFATATSAHRARMFLVMREPILQAYATYRVGGGSVDGLVMALFDAGDPVGASILAALGVDMRRVGTQVTAVLVSRATVIDIIEKTHPGLGTHELHPTRPGVLCTVAVYEGYSQYEIPLGDLPFTAPGGDA